MPKTIILSTDAIYRKHAYSVCVYMCGYINRGKCRYKYFITGNPLFIRTLCWQWEVGCGNGWWGVGVLVWWAGSRWFGVEGDQQNAKAASIGTWKI